MEHEEEWSVEKHLAEKSKGVVDIYERFIALVPACGPYAVSVTKTAVAFKGTRRGFAGAKPRKSSLDGFLDLQREVRDERFLRASPYTKSLFVHQFRITNAAQLDGSFAARVEEAYQVGQGAHRLPRKWIDRHSTPGDFTLHDWDSRSFTEGHHQVFPVPRLTLFRRQRHPRSLLAEAATSAST